MVTRLARFEAKFDDMTLGESLKSLGHTNGNGGTRDASFATGDAKMIANEIRAMRKMLGMSAPTFDQAPGRRPIEVSAH